MKLALDFAIGSYFIGNGIGKYGNFFETLSGFEALFLGIVLIINDL